MAGRFDIQKAIAGQHQGIFIETTKVAFLSFVDLVYILG
jgi:hypothetical protein